MIHSVGDYALEVNACCHAGYCRVFKDLRKCRQSPRQVRWQRLHPTAF